MLFSPVFNFVVAKHFIHKHRVTYQHQLDNRGILTQMNEPQVHLLMLRNTFTSLELQMKNGFERLYVLNLQLKFHDLSLILAKPDLAITAPHEAFPSMHPVINPAVIIELLSPYNEREKKFKQYCEIASLREYVRIETDRYLVEHLVRQPGMEWTCSQIENWEETVPLVSIDAHLSLADVYKNCKDCL